MYKGVWRVLCVVFYLLVRTIWSCSGEESSMLGSWLRLNHPISPLVRSGWVMGSVTTQSNHSQSFVSAPWPEKQTAVFLIGDDNVIVLLIMWCSFHLCSASRGKSLIFSVPYWRGVSVFDWQQPALSPAGSVLSAMAVKKSDCASFWMGFTLRL